MANAGEQTEVVNVTRASLTQSTDSLTFGQLFNMKMNISRAFKKVQTTDGNFKKFYSTGDNYVEGDILLTTPEMATLKNYTVLTNGDLPTKNWQLGFTDVSGAAVTVTMSAQLSTLQLIRQTEGGVLFHIRLELTTDTITVA